ncbi:ComF family protein [Candidatus Roizmanbacteria bacterium]|nr:ComF family protein [Candidatus Roizmanbacteria bacterium]
MSLLDIFFPAKCFGCGYLGVYICPSCEKQLHPIEKQPCIYCNKPSLYGLTHPKCRRHEGVDGFVSLFHYDNLLKKIIKGIKYSFVTAAQNDLFYLIAKYGQDPLIYYKKRKNLFIQPVPLSEEKQRTRGFNQAKIIGGVLSFLTNIKSAELIKRQKNTEIQAKIKDRRKRRENMRGAFSLNKEQIGIKEILLVDDVVTSGSTVKEAAKILKIGGAKKVYVFSVAKG